MMYAVISDVHGNRWALEAVLHDMASRPVDIVMNLGDSLYGPLQPRETALLLKECCDIHVLGNQDRLLLEPQPQGHSATYAWCMKNLTSGELDWLRGSHRSSIALDHLLLLHGTAESDSAYLLEDVSRGFPVLLPPEHIEERIGPTDAQIILCGHSHIPRCVRIGGKLVVNPGSVGLQAYDDDAPVHHLMETGSPDARYAILEVEGGRCIVHQIVVPYDSREAIACAHNNGRNDWAYWLEFGRVRHS